VWGVKNTDKIQELTAAAKAAKETSMAANKAYSDAVAAATAASDTYMDLATIAAATSGAALPPTFKVALDDAKDKAVLTATAEAVAGRSAAQADRLAAQAGREASAAERSAFTQHGHHLFYTQQAANQRSRLSKRDDTV
jgi:hypothetical protein